MIKLLSFMMMVFFVYYYIYFVISCYVTNVVGVGGDKADDNNKNPSIILPTTTTTTIAKKIRTRAIITRNTQVTDSLPLNPLIPIINNTTTTPTTTTITNETNLIYDNNNPVIPDNVEYVICSVCNGFYNDNIANESFLSNPNVMIQPGTIYYLLTTPTSCSSIDTMAKTSMFTITQCITIGTSMVPTLCGCSTSTTTTTTDNNDLFNNNITFLDDDLFNNTNNISTTSPTTTSPTTASPALLSFGTIAPTSRGTNTATTTTNNAGTFGPSNNTTTNNNNNNETTSSAAPSDETTTIPPSNLVNPDMTDPPTEELVNDDEKTFFGLSTIYFALIVGTASAVLLLFVLLFIYRCTKSNKATTANAPPAASQRTIIDKSKMLEKIIDAPAGKLGITIGTIPEGLIISNINDTSPLKGQVQVNDIILQIDEIVTTDMYVSEVRELLAARAKKPRKLTLLTTTKNQKDHYKDWIEQTITIGYGKLRLRVDPTAIGLVVEEIYPDSPLLNKINDCDVIIAINNISTCSITKGKLNELLSSIENTNKDITILTPNPDTLPKNPNDYDNEEVGLVHEAITVGPGKLGISVDRRSNGLIVLNIHPDSLLYSKVMISDVITSINDTSTFSISEKKLTNLLQSVQDTEKVLSILTRKQSMKPLDL